VISGAEEHIMRTTVSIAQSLKLDSQLITKPLDLTELRNALVKRRSSAVAIRGNNLLSQSIRQGALS
jgi:hypothetical protein